jgi:hypothetical protein
MGRPHKQARRRAQAPIAAPEPGRIVSVNLANTQCEADMTDRIIHEADSSGDSTETADDRAAKAAGKAPKEREPSPAEAFEEEGAGVAAKE